MTGAVDAEHRRELVLAGARTILQAELAVLARPGPGGGFTVNRLDTAGRQTVSWLAEPGPLGQSVLDGGPSVLVAGIPPGSGLDALLGREVVANAMVAPLRTGDGPLGLLAVANAPGDGKVFRAADRELFDTLVSHASVGIHNDGLVTRLRREAADRAYEATHDSLTGLASRSLFLKRLEQAVTDHQAAVAVLLIDLDRFKEVNDTLGHHAGDLLLRQTAGRLLEVAGPDRLVARLGGDEFAVLVTAPMTRSMALAWAKRVCDALQNPYLLQGISIELTASVGVVTGPVDGSDLSTLLQRADVAMYQAKSSHHGVLTYLPEHDHHSRRRLSLAGALRPAVERGELDVAYQPVARLADGRMLGAEALVRWDHPELGPILPGEFLPLAERTGVIRALTWLVLEKALGRCAEWRALGLDVGVHVNLATRCLADPDLVGKVTSLLAEAGTPAECLTLEVTESDLMTDLTTSLAALHRLRDTGVTLAIDDFGVGYSSLAYVQQMPCQMIKIDKSFVHGLDQDRADLVIVRSTVELAHSLGLEVVAEGVEDRATWERLRSLGCDSAQGHVLAPPLAADELVRWALDRERSVRSPRGRPGAVVSSG
ncbi:MAG: putative bifunctional diguanylate cyclase/phosphodiesterase, partial [Acidimicrobiales bacterium]